MNKFINNHPFHLVTLSPWPLILSTNLLTMFIGMTKLFHEFNFNLLSISMMLMLMSMYQWWRDITRESTFQGSHTMNVSKLLRLGMILFIISEIFFFMSFFWSFFHNFLSPSIEIGSKWPPQMLMMFNPYNIPLLNTIILLSSGITITWTHYSILNKNFNKSKFSLFLTILLGLYFSLLQYMEYNESSFNMSDCTYGSIFFMITGFHGLHVIIGTLFIMITYLRLNNLHFSNKHHFGFEASSWYWHFVDVVWLFVYIFLYWMSYYF